MGEKLKKRLKQEKFTNTAQEAILNLFLSNNFLRKKTDDVCAKHGITNAQYNVLRILKGVHPEGHPRCEIITRMIDQAPDVTRIVDNLEKQNLIERFNSPDDRRLSVTKITKKGLDLLVKMDEEMNGTEKYVTDALSKKEIEQLSEICEKIYGPHI
ncbi:MAG: MarR family transcriptional regulator [Ignavibacteriaceae bacterium]